MCAIAGLLATMSRKRAIASRVNSGAQLHLLASSSGHWRTYELTWMGTMWRKTKESGEEQEKQQHKRNLSWTDGISIQLIVMGTGAILYRGKRGGI